MRANGESGFSIIELTIAALLTVGLIGSIFSLMNKNQQVFVTESGVTDLNQNVRVALDFMTRDIQSAGMGMARPNSSFAAIFSNDGASSAPDQILIVNADPFAPTAELQPQAAGSATFFLTPPNDLKATGNGSNWQFTYTDLHDNTTKKLFEAYATTKKYYICYDDTKALIFGLSDGGQLISGGSKIQLNHDTNVSINRPGIFGTTLDQLFSTPVDAGEPNYNSAQVSTVGSLISYRVNLNTHDLERTEDLTNWYTIARGVTNLQIQYRVVQKNSGNVEEIITSSPTDRKAIRAALVTISAETVGVQPGDKRYRQIIQTFEVAPRNFNLLNNNNLSSNTKGTWNF